MSTYYSINEYVGDGSTKQFAINFTLNYIERDDVLVVVDEQIVPFTWISEGIIELDTAPSVGAIVVLMRDTDLQQLINDYNNGSVIIEENMDESFLQCILSVQEVKDALKRTLKYNPFIKEFDARVDGVSYRISNVENPVEQQDAVTLNYLYNDFLDFLQSYIDDAVAAYVPTITVELNELTDVSTTGSVAGQVLTKQADGTYAFEDGGTSSSSGDTGATILDELTDVSTAGSVTGQVLTKQADGTYAFENDDIGATTLDELTDVSTLGGATGDYLRQLSDGTFAIQDFNEDLNSLSDVDTSAATEGDYLVKKADGSYGFETIDPAEAQRGEDIYTVGVVYSETDPSVVVETGDFLTLKEAFEVLSNKIPVYSEVTDSTGGARLQLLSGYIIEESIAVDGIDLSWVTIEPHINTTQTDIDYNACLATNTASPFSELGVNSNYVFLGINGGKLPSFKGTYVAKSAETSTQETNFISVVGNGSSVILDGCIINDCPFIAAYCGYGASLEARSTCGMAGATFGAVVVEAVATANISSTTISNCGRGVVAINSATVSLYNVTISGCSGEGVSVNNGASVRGSLVTSQSNTKEALYVVYNSKASFSQSTFSSSSASDNVVFDASLGLLDSCNISNNATTTYGLADLKTSTVIFEGTLNVSNFDAGTYGVRCGDLTDLKTSQDLTDITRSGNFTNTFVSGSATARLVVPPELTT